MRGTYIVPATNVTVANQAVTLVFVNPGTTASLEFVRAWISQAANATSAQQRCQLNTQVTAFPTMVTQAPVTTAMLDAASVITAGTGGAGTSGINASAENGGTKTVRIPDAFNVLNGWLWVPTPYETILISASGAAGLGLHFPAAPGTLTNWNAGLVFREL